MPMHARALILIAGMLFPSVLPAPAIPSEARCSINAAIDSISYKGDDSYLITVTLSVADSENSRSNDFEEHFFVQTDKGWSPLKVSKSDTAFTAGDVSGTSKKESLKLLIPLNAPDLFRTYEGDISLMQKIRYECADNRGGESRKEEERLYWITPRTSRWILREGM